MAGSEFSPIRHFLVLALTVLVFLSGLSLGALLNQEQVGALEREIVFLRETGDSAYVGSMLADELGGSAACSVLESEISRQGATLDTLSGRLTEYENSRKFGESFVELKSKYTSLLVRVWLLARKYDFRCAVGQGAGISTAIYFYKNEGCPECTDQGVVLDIEKTKMGEKLLVFPIDTDVPSSEAVLLMSAFNITKYPSIVIGKDRVLSGFVPKDALELELAG